MSENHLRAARTTSIMALFTLLNEPYSSQVLKINEIKFILMFMCLNRCKETEDPVQSIRIMAHPDSSPTPNRNSRGSPQEPTAMDNTLMLESRAALVSNSCGLMGQIFDFVKVIVTDWTFSPADAAFSIDLQNFRKPGEKTYTQRSRLFVGNLPTGTTEEDVEKLFTKYGKPSEIFINKERGFGFIRLVSLKENEAESDYGSRAGRYIERNDHAHLVSKASSVISSKSPSPVFKWSGI